MLGILFFGVLTGLTTASLFKDFSFAKMVGWIVISSIGAFEGYILAIFLEGYSNSATYLTPLFTVMGSLLLISLKLLFRPRVHSPITEAV